MPDPTPRRRLARRTEPAEAPPQEPALEELAELDEPDPDERVQRRAAGRAARTSARARRAPPKSPLVPIAAGGGVLVIAVIAFLLLRSGDDEQAGSATTDATATPAATSAASPPAQIETSPPVAPEIAKAPEPAPAPKPPAPTAASVRRKLAAATTAAEATIAAHESERAGDAALVAECWTRVLELDPDDEEAREKLEVRRLDPATELRGYDAIAATPHRVHLAEFLDEARRETTKAQRAEIVARWEAARPVLEGRVEKARTQPFFREIDALRLALQQHAFFGSLEYQMVETPPYALFVEVEGTPDERRQRRDDAEKAYVPYLAAYDAKIRSYLVPLAPKPLDADPPFPVFVFLRYERYRDYCVAASGEVPPPSRRAHYESRKKQSFTYSPVLKPGYGAFLDGTQTLLHELTHAWVDQLASSDGGETRGIGNLTSHWFSEGIAEYMSCQFVHQGQVRFQPWRSNRVAGQYRPPGWRIPLREALTIPLGGLDAWAALRVQDLAPEKQQSATGTISSGFYADMSNFILWLNLKSGAGRPQQFEAYAREELAGRGGFEAFERCVPGLLDEVEDLDATIDDFVKRIANGKINPYKEFEEAQPKAAGAAE